MKILFFLVSSIFYSTLHSQRIQGLYLSADDFRNSRLSFEETKELSPKIKSGLYSNNAFIKIKYNDSVFAFKKDLLFGYKDKENIIHRFYNKNRYTILNPKESILIYKTETNTGTPKYPQLSTSYFFSRSAASEINVLSLTTIITVFKEDVDFTNLIELHFHNDKELLEYDPYHMEYKLNRLYELSKHEKNK